MFVNLLITLPYWVEDTSALFHVNLVCHQHYVTCRFSSSLFRFRNLPSHFLHPICSRDARSLDLASRVVNRSINKPFVPFWLEEMEKKSSLRQRCCSWLSFGRAKNDHSPSASPNQVTALARIMETDYPASDPSADRRRYEMNMLLLFRLFVARRYHKKIEGEMNDETKESLRRLLLFIHTIPDLRRVYKEYRRERHGVFLTDLAVYWRKLPSNEETMMYKDIWEHVAQRPLAWEGLPAWHPKGWPET